MRIGTWAIALILGTAASAASARIPQGVWANPANSVHVTFAPCGPRMCGTVVWASPKAERDAEEGGGGRLVGSRLFRDFEPDGPDSWSGQVFVPDIGQTLQGTITQIDARTLRGEGCLLGGFGCKAQTWRRLK